MRCSSARLSLRTRGVYFIMVTLAFAQMAFFVFHDTKLGGGSDGIYMYVRPALGALDLENRTVLFYVVLAALVFTYGLLALIRRSRFGAALAGIRVNEQRMRAAGFAVYGYKLAAFVIAGALAGLAGFLLASRDGVVNPELMAWHNSGEVLLMIILGGLGHLRGAVIGAVAFTLLKELLLDACAGGPAGGPLAADAGAGDHRVRGAAAQGPHRPASQRLSPKRRPHERPHCLPSKRSRAASAALAAVNAVTLDLHVGEVHAVIGTNGAGKSTLINMLSGEIEASDGRIALDGVDITGRARSRSARATAWAAATSARPSSRSSACTENCRLAAQAATPKPWAFWQSSKHCATSNASADAALDAAGLAHEAGRIAGTHEPRRAAPARSGDVPGDQRRACCCSTSRSPAWAPRKPTACSRCSRG